MEGRYFIFFFKQKTAYEMRISDWSSDVCSSDLLTRNRRGWIAAGLVLTILLLLAVPLAKDVWTLIGIILLWQLALHMVLSPLAAWAGDCVPDEQKGLLVGLIALSPPLGAWAGAILTTPGLVPETGSAT